MNIFNPSALFYFTTCLRLDDSEAELYHSIIETLTREKNKEEEILIAIKNILICDAPFQIYSFPFVLNQIPSLNKNLPTVKRVLKEYSAIFISLFGEENKAISELLNEVVDIPRNENITEQLIALAETSYAFHDALQESESNLPYIDIVEFGAEAITLNLLNYFCDKQEVLNALIDYLDENQNGILYLLIENSYAHKRGRICFLLSAELKRKLQFIDSKEEFRRHIWKNKLVSSCPDLEPDLLFLFLTHWFVFLDKGNSEEQKLKNILYELGDLNLYSTLVIANNYTTKREEFVHKNYAKHLRILLGAEINSSAAFFEKNCISINIWLGSIYLLIAKHFEIALSEPILLKIWEPINLNAPGIIFNTKYELINENIASIINSKSGGNVTKKKVQKNNFRILSPWLVFDSSQKFQKNYVQIDLYANWLRTIYAVEVSKSILLRSKSQKRESFANYIVHVSELLSYSSVVTKQQLSADEKDAVKIRLFEKYLAQPQLRKLMLIINRDVNILIGGDCLTGLGREYFVSLLNPNDKSSEWFEYFYKIVIPRVLYNWIYNSLQTKPVNSKNDNQKQIFQTLEELSNHRNNIRLKLLRKFLYHDEIERVDNCKNELDKIFLLKPNTISDIPDYDKRSWLNKSEDDSQYAIKKQVSFAIAIQRYAFALRTGLQPSDQYRDDLLEILKSIRTGSDLSYLNRFAIISLFTHFEKIKEDNRNVFTFSIEVLFELNGLLDISLLRDMIIDKLITLDNYKFNESQIEVLNCLSNSVSISLNYGIHERNNTDKPTDPLQNIQQDRKIELLRHFLNTIQFVISKCKKQLGHKVRVSNYPHTTKSDYEIFETDVSVRNNIPHFSLPQKWKDNLTEELSLITYNAWEQIAQFYIRDIAIPKGTINFFELSPDEKTRTLSETSSSILIAAKCLGTVPQGNQIKYKFQLDKNTVELQALPGCKIAEGELVQLKYFYSQNYQQWFIDNKHCAKISTFSVADNPLLIINKVEELKNYDLPYSYWLPCHADIFTGYLQSQLGTSGVSIIISDKKKPVFSFFNTLLARVKDITDIISLTFISVEWDANRQEYGYLFYQSFGHYFLLFEDEISFAGSEDRTLAEMMIHEIGNDDADILWLNGLIISFKLSYTNSFVKLAFAPTELEKNYQSDERFPFLKIPFDNRNIRWRTLFDESEDVEFTARNVKGDWLFEIDDSWVQLGFKKKISVELDKKPNYLNEIDFLLAKGWAEDGGRFKHVISGKIIERSVIKLSQLKKYLELEENQRVFIKTPQQLLKKSATIPCYSNDNYRVSLNMEELTFLPINPDVKSFAKAFEEDNFFVSNVTKWRKVPTDLIVNNFPKDHLSGVEAVAGYFINVPRRREQGVCSCSIALELDDSTLIGDIDIEIQNIASDEIQKALSVYSRFEGRFINNEWHFHLLTRQIFIKSLKTLREIEHGDIDDYYFLGKGSLNGETKYLFERENDYGVLFYTDQISEGMFKNELYCSPDQITTNWISQALGNNVPRIGFVNQNVMITGGIKNRINLQLNQSAYLRGITFDFDHFEKNTFFVKRSFTIAAIPLQQKEVKSEAPSLKDGRANDRYQLRLNQRDEAGQFKLTTARQTKVTVLAGAN